MVLVPLQAVPGGMEMLLWIGVVALILGFIVSAVGGSRKYCRNCQQNVNAAKGFSWLIFLLLLVFGFGVGAFLYIIYYLVMKRKTCPICGGRNFGQPAQGYPQQGQQGRQPHQQQGQHQGHQQQPQGGQYQQGQQGSNQQNQNY